MDNFWLIVIIILHKQSMESLFRYSLFLFFLDSDSNIVIILLVRSCWRSFAMRFSCCVRNSWRWPKLKAFICAMVLGIGSKVFPECVNKGHWKVGQGGAESDNKSGVIWFGKSIQFFALYFFSSKDNRNEKCELFFSWNYYYC